MNKPLNAASPIRWVFLDLDDTLWDFTANSDAALLQLYNTKEYLYTNFNSFEEFSQIYHRENDRLWELYHHGKIDTGYLKKERFRATLSVHLAEETTKRYAPELNDEYLVILASQSRVTPGAEEILQYLSRKYLIGILSNGFIDVQYRKLYGGNMWRYVQRMIVSDEIGINKPDKRIFDYALEETGAQAASSVMVGDNPDADIAGAVGAGWRAIYFDKRGKSCDVEGVARITDLRELKNYL